MVNNNSKFSNLGEIVKSVGENFNKEGSPSYRFEIFKGKLNEDGKVSRLRSVGSAYLRDGMRTYTIVLKTFLDDRFYLIPNSKPENNSDFVILTREAAQNLKRKYFWNSVGEGKLLEGSNAGLVKLSWDVLSDDLYLCLHPLKVSEPAGECETKAA